MDFRQPMVPVRKLQRDRQLAQVQLADAGYVGALDAIREHVAHRLRIGGQHVFETRAGRPGFRRGGI